MQNGKPISMEKLVADYGHKNIMSDSYYPNKHINEILNYYAVGHKDINFLMPIGAMRAILSLMDISKNKLLLLSSDKAYSHAEELLNSDGPSFAFHGSFSLMVNLHAIGEFVKKFNGDVLHQSLRRGLKTSLFLIGQNLNDLPETKQAFMDYSDYYGPADYLNCHQMLKPLADTINMSTLASHLFFCRWDPYVLKFFCKKICENISTEPDSSRQTFIEGFEKAAELFYYSPGCDNMFFEIGYFFHIIKHYEKAINYYNQAIHYFGEQSSTLSNIGHCLYYMNKKVAALGQFEKALALTPDSKDIATWIETIRKDLGFEDEKSITTT
jgi:tetratricopeptide (TPR) repeat protein